MKLRRHFYADPTLEVARGLIGKVLVRATGRTIMAGRIVETEAYVGQDDLACHASKGRTRRTEIMFGPPGHAYVYLVYGMYSCLNVVTEEPGYPAAVLIRAIEPLDGTEQMRRNRGGGVQDTGIGSGPGKLCQAMSVDRRLNAVSLSGSRLWIEDRGLEPGTILRSPRIGVDYAGPFRDKLWRFFVRENPHVSKHRLNGAGIARSGKSRES